ncbi:hypothetical protein IV38_GL001222 [Lactobacillus selangorensis]|uniref:Membrane ancor connecting MutS2 with cell-division Z-ring n=1 Tax=Lactobacillus selangorensis TaxID=81857 RepID=A0A0R2FKC3_9LACO|nr:CvpA family protein [Lactobacillus selangorensis]KRN29008.1 hypothetical protein IV38_GL001222 [Lactobacillus selangorensis]KRN32582.1 hypothetical protein IV40_GL000631 [Lactobacillus selangorensis]
MLLTGLILIWLLIALWRGWEKGFFVEIIHSIGYLAVLIATWLFYQPVASWLQTAFGGGNLLIYRTVSFFGLSLIGSFLIQLISRSTRLITFLPIIHQLNSFAGAAVSFILAYLGIFILLSFFSLAATENMKTQYAASPVAQFIVEKTPGISSDVLSKILHHESTTDTTDTTTNTAASQSEVTE